MSHLHSLGLLGLPHGTEWIALVVIGLLLFGKKLPGLARSVGASVVEFKKGIKGVKDDAEEQANAPAPKDPYRIAAKENKQVIETEATTVATKPVADAPAK